MRSAEKVPKMNDRNTPSLTSGASEDAIPAMRARMPNPKMP